MNHQGTEKWEEEFDDKFMIGEVWRSDAWPSDVIPFIRQQIAAAKEAGYKEGLDSAVGDRKWYGD